MNKAVPYHTPQVNVWRFDAPTAGGRIQRPENGGGGILIAKGFMPMHAPVVLIADADGAGLVNTGCSATNCVAQIISEMVRLVTPSAATMFSFIELDSEGRFDVIWPTFDSDMKVQSLNFSPLRSIDGSPRCSAKAFVSNFPTLGPLMLEKLSQQYGAQFKV